MKTLLFLITIAPVVLFSQDKNLKSYYQLIDKAELFIVKDDYKAAVKLYYSAEKFRYLFGVDLLNAATASAKNGSTSDVLYFTKKLFERGYKVENFSDKQLFPDFQPFYKEILEVSKIAKVSKQINMEYRSELLKMRELDQKFLQSMEMRRKNADTITKIFQGNALRLIELIKQNGFPSEEIVGIEPESISCLASVFILHQSTGPKQIINFSKIVEEAVLNGEYDNRVGALMIELSEGRQNLIYNAFSMSRGRFDSVMTISQIDGSTIKKDTTFYTNWGFGKLTSDELKLFNQRRKDLLLDSVSNSVKKSLYQMYHKEFALGNRDAGFTIGWKNYKDYLHQQNNLQYTIPE